ncbi:MAG: response regulator [Cyanobacteria bacterium P01_F01_bin.150]
MQGELREIDIRSILQLVEVGQRTGELLVEAYSSLSSSDERRRDFSLPVYDKKVLEPRVSKQGRSSVQTFWFIFFIQGHIAYASDESGDLNRLRDYLCRYDLADKVRQFIDQRFMDTRDNESLANYAGLHNTPEYSCLWSLLERGLITSAQGRSIVKGMIRETLFDLLSLHQGAFIFEMSSPLSPALVSVECLPLIGHIMQRIQLWKQLHPLIQSPDQCPFIDNHQPLQKSLKPGNYALLRQWATGNVSIRQIARYLNRDVVSVAKALYPYVLQGIVHLSDIPETPQSERPKALAHKRNLSIQQVDSEPFSSQVPRVLCIDDGIVLRQTVDAILKEQGYEAVMLNNPLDALGQVFRLKPDLILCDIAMPELDGYEVCAMLRKSTAFRQVPIVMLTGKDGFIDRVKARMVGANDYLTKPFSGLELLTLVELYVGKPSLIQQAVPREAFPLADIIPTD